MCVVGLSRSPAFALLETMRWEGQATGFPLLARHLARLASSASHFGYPYDAQAVRAALKEAMAGVHAEPLRVRLLLGPDGVVRVTAGPIGAPMERALLHPDPVVPGGPFWIHKTTHRPHYEHPFQQARTAGYDEAILLDAGGRVVEGTRTTVWVERAGSLLTPPREAGGLPGVHRAHVLATHPGAAEATLTWSDLRAAEAVYLANAVRGLQRVAVFDRSGLPLHLPHPI